MAIAYDNQDQSVVYGNFSSAFTIGSGSDRILLAFLFAASGSEIYHTNIQYNSTAMTRLASGIGDTSGSEANTLDIYYMLESSLPSTGSYNFTGTGASGLWVGGFHLLSLSGAYQGAPEASSGYTDTTTRTSWSNSITTLTSNAWIVEGLSIWNGSSASPSSGQTQRGTNLAMYGNYNGCISTELKASAGAETNGWSWTSGAYINLHWLLSIAEAGATTAADNAPFFGSFF